MTLDTDLAGPCSWGLRAGREQLAAGRISHVEHVDALRERLPVADFGTADLGRTVEALLREL